MGERTVRRRPDWELHSAVDDDPADLIALYNAACERSRSIVRDTDSLDALSERISEREGRAFSLRWILLHLIEETVVVRAPIVGAFSEKRRRLAQTPPKSIRPCETTPPSAQDQAADSAHQRLVAPDVHRDCRICGAIDSRQAKALEVTLREALRFGHDDIGTEHILLAILGTEPDDGFLIALGIHRTRR